jgi:hypothetical protein
MSYYRFELATAADDADLRHIMAETPMAGPVSVSFRREPSYFAAAVVEGQFRQVVVCRETDSGHVVGFGARAVHERYVNGERRSIGYLSSIRLLAAHRNRGLVSRGYALFRQLHADGRTPLYLTTIAEGNALALATLTSRRAGLPGYHFAGRYHTVALPLLRRRRFLDCSMPGLTIRPATPDDLPAALEFLERVGPRRQFFPYHEHDGLFAPQGTFRDLDPAGLLLAWKGVQLVGALAGWDQHAFRQTVVHDYSPVLRWARPLVNGWAWIRGWPGIPARGDSLRYLVAALPVVDGDPAVFRALVDALRQQAAGGPWDYLLVGLHEADPLLPVLRSYSAREYTTRLYLVCWDDGDALRRSLDDRSPYLELGCL